MKSTDWILWLPEAALDGDAVGAAVAETVAQWSEKWFARAPWRLSGGLRRGGRAKTEVEAEWHRLDEGFAVCVPKALRFRLAAAMLDVAIDEKGLSGADRALIGRLVDGCLDDLRGRLVQLLRLPRDKAWREGRPDDAFLDEARACAIIGPDAGEGLRILIAPDLFVALVKLAVRSAPAPILLRPLAEGLARQPVELGAYVGGCDLPLSEIGSLGLGDVVVLDRDVAAPLELALDRKARAGRCRIGFEDERIHLQVERPFCE